MEISVLHSMGELGGLGDLVALGLPSKLEEAVFVGVHVVRELAEAVPDLGRDVVVGGGRDGGRQLGLSVYRCVAAGVKLFFVFLGALPCTCAPSLTFYSFFSSFCFHSYFGVLRLSIRVAPLVASAAGKLFFQGACPRPMQLQKASQMQWR